MSDRFSRTELLLGAESMEKLANARVAVFGIGGVGGFAAEAIARCGVGAMDIIDNDRVSESNINRQIIALGSTIGRYKTDVMKERLLDINPDLKITAYNCFYLPETADEFDFSDYSYVVDAVDTVTAKIDIIVRCKALNVPVISCMGAGNKLDPTMLEVSDIYKTSVCPLAKVMRRELKKRGIDSLKVVYSKEEPIKHKCATKEHTGRRAIPGSVSFVPSVAGLIMAGEVVRELTLLR